MLIYLQEEISIGLVDSIVGFKLQSIVSLLIFSMFNASFYLYLPVLPAQRFMHLPGLAAA